MNTKRTLIYNHPELGEMYIDHSTHCYELYQEKKFKELNTKLKELHGKCYNKNGCNLG